MKHMKWNCIDSNIVFSAGGVRDVTDCHPSRSSLPVWVFTIVEKGQRTLLLNGEEIRIKKNEFFLLPPNTAQEPLECDNHTACYIHFKANGIEVPAPEYIDASKIILPIMAKLPLRFDVFNYIDAMIEHSMSPYADQEFLSLQIKAILSMLSLECQKKHQCEQSEEISERILAFVQKNACTPLCSQDYEKHFCWSYHHINQIFKSKFGCTVKQYHFKIRMEQAAHMLMYGKSIQQTAIDCGFDDYFYFLNSFKKAHGVSPSAYKKQMWLTNK